jgi:hypothetical protein
VGSTLGPEAALLLDCARARFDPAVRVRVRERIHGALDWPRLLLLAERHGVTPLLFLELEYATGAGRDRDEYPPPALATLRARASRNTARQLLLVAELRDVLGAFESHGIQAVPFKGPALAAAVYGNVALREARDLDLLVRRADVPAAERVLLERGYRREDRLTRAAEGVQLAHGCDLELRRPDGLMVELHWAVLHRYFSFPIETTCWERLTRASLLGREVPSLAPEDLLLVLCGHGAKHCWERLVWVCDVAALLGRYRDLDWDEVWRQAERLRARRMLGLGLFLAGEWLGAGLPEDASRRVRSDRAIPGLAACAARSMAAGEQPFHPTWKSLFHLRARDRLADRVRYLARRALQLNANDWTSVSFPDALHFLYYPLRLIRVLHAHAAAAAGLVTRRSRAQKPQLKPKRIPTPS